MIRDLLVYILCFLLFCSFPIGLVFSLVGCLSTPNYVDYSLRKVSIVDYEVNARTCSSCVKSTRKCRTCGRGQRCCSNVCVKQVSYTCYNSYAIAEFKIDEQNKTCSILVAEAYGSTEEALKKAQSKYKQGKQYTFSVHKEKFTCETDSGTLRLAIAGFVFLGIFGLDALILIFICLLNKRAKKAANKPQNGNTNTTVISNSNARPQMPEAHETTQTPENDI